MFLPTTAGPLLVDVEIRLAEELLTDEFDGRIAKLMEDAKGDADQLSWEELFSYVADNPQQFGRQPGFNRGQYREMTRRYDRNRNRRPDKDEIVRFLFRNRGIEVPFRLIGTMRNPSSV